MQASSFTYTSIFEQMADLCDRLSGEDLIICGDLNCPGTESTLVDDRLSDVIRDHSLFQFVQGSTRRFGTKDLSGNVLDVVIGRQNSLIQDDIKITEVGYSDHISTQFSFFSFGDPSY